MNRKPLRGKAELERVKGELTDTKASGHVDHCEAAKEVEGLKKDVGFEKDRVRFQVKKVDKFRTALKYQARKHEAELLRAEANGVRWVLDKSSFHSRASKYYAEERETNLRAQAAALEAKPKEKS